MLVRENWEERTSRQTQAHTQRHIPWHRRQTKRRLKQRDCDLTTVKTCWTKRKQTGSLKPAQRQRGQTDGAAGRMTSLSVGAGACHSCQRIKWQRGGGCEYPNMVQNKSQETGRKHHYRSITPWTQPVSASPLW
ncbi:uncharacterized protein LOC144512248 [Sander vitreus]